MIHLYRIQHRENPHLGAFRLMFFRETPVTLAKRVGFHPDIHNTPREDGHEIREDEFCAFADFRQFEEWFTTPQQRRAVLSHPDYELVMLTVTTAIHLPHQSIFRYEDVVEYEPCDYREGKSPTSCAPPRELSFSDLISLAPVAMNTPSANALA